MKSKRILNLILALLCAVSLAFGAACTDGTQDETGPRLSAVFITEKPAKTDYMEGETFDPAGMVVTVKYTDNETKTVTDYTVSPSGALEVGTTQVTVSYTDNNVTKSANVDITVRPDSNLVELTVLARPVKVDYMVGDMLELKDLTLLAKYSDGSSREIKSGYTCAQLDKPLTTDDEKIVVSYTEKDITKTAQFNITLSYPFVLDSIEVTKQPAKTAYAEGEVFNPEGMEVTANSVHGQTRVITGYTYSNAPLTKDTNKVTISYAEGNITKTVDVAITINKWLESITATCDHVFKVNETFKPEWITVTANYSDSTTTPIESFTVNKTGKITLADNGAQLEVTIGDKTTTVTISVTDFTGTPFEMGIEDAAGTNVDGSSSEQAKAFITEHKYKENLNTNVDGVAFRFKSSADQMVRVDIVMAANESGDMLLKDIFDVSLNGVRLTDEVEENVANPNKIAYFYFQLVTVYITVPEGDNTLRFVSHGGSGTNLAGVILTPEDNTKTVGEMTTPIYRIECEWAKLSGTVSDGGKSFIMANKPNNSNNRTLGFFGGDARLEFEVNSDRATTAKFAVCIASAFGPNGNTEKPFTSAWRVTVNGVEPESYKNVMIVPSDWAKQPVGVGGYDATAHYNDFVVVQFEIELVEGANTIVLDFAGGGDLDYVELTTEAIITYEKVNNPDR